MNAYILSFAFLVNVMALFDLPLSIFRKFQSLQTKLVSNFNFVLLSNPLSVL